jgi:thiamine biosynthesis lipoprotein
MMIARGDVEAMGGRVAITAVGIEQSAVADSIRTIRELERLWTRFDASSDLMRMNLAAGRPVVVDHRTVQLIGLLAPLVRETGGAFDPTVLPDLIAAGYRDSRVSGRPTPTLPPGSRRGGDLDAIRVDGRRVTLPHGMALDFGGIAKGHTADLVAAELRARGASGGLVGIAGDLVVWGASPEGGPWRIGVEDARDAQRWVAVAELEGGAIATSSRWKRRWQVGGENRSHLIDPRTGRTIDSGLLSFTVMASTGARAEAWAKVGFVRPWARALAEADRAGLGALAILESGDLESNTNWNRHAG